MDRSWTGEGTRRRTAATDAGPWLAVLGSLLLLLGGCRVGYDASQLQGTVDVLPGVDAVGDGSGGGDAPVTDGGRVDGAGDAGVLPDGGRPDAGPPPEPVCGDGSMNQPGEECDDGNVRGGDGCASDCTVEELWTCLGAPSKCTPICGDGYIVRVPGDPDPTLDPTVAQEGLPCDDGNAVGGDGCDATCHTEPGWTCEPSSPPVAVPQGADGPGAPEGDVPVEGTGATAWRGPSVCHGFCGDGFVTSDEECDNGMAVVPLGSDGEPVGEPVPWTDGCDETCHVEDGWQCSTDQDGASVCSTQCGDGFVVEPLEACDDGNGEPGDGCDLNCQVEEHWECAPWNPSPCWPACGDGYVVPGQEACDDGNLEPGDGCDADCQPEEGWSCDAQDALGTDVVCTPLCGDGKVVGWEECDDGVDAENNPWSGSEDGCDVCKPSQGWTCDPASVAPDGSWVHQCKPLCGDGLVLNSGLPDGVVPEQCDDGNPFPGDGCAPDCKVEDGWGCGHLPGGASVCNPNCGDGKRVGPEACDDGNGVAGDGCAPDCTVEAGWVCGGPQGGASQCAISCLDADGDGYGVGPDCLGEDCDDEHANANPGISEEFCDDGVDNDCDGLTDAVVCGDSDEGVCQQGVAYCQGDGDFGPCVGKIGAAPVELCNGLDDTCDGHTDQVLQADGSFGPLTQTCGLGECAATAEVCAGGELVVCQPNWGKAKAHEECGNGKDDDCDGVVDEGCGPDNGVDGCIWVAGPSAVRDPAWEMGNWRNPLSSIQTAIDWASTNGWGQDVCVLGAPGCGLGALVPPPELSGDFEMADGVSVLGGFVVPPAGGGQPAQEEGCGAVLVVTGPEGVHFDGIQSPTMLQGLRVRSEYASTMGGNGGEDGMWAAAVTIDDSPGAIVSDCWISGSPTAPLSAGVLVRGGVGAETGPLLRASRILGGGFLQSAGVRSENARPRIEDACDEGLVVDGRCVGTCNPADGASYSDRLILGGVDVLSENATVAQNAVGVWLVDSPGARVARSVICGFGGDIAEGVRVEGNAAGTVIATSSVAAAGGSVHDAAVHAKACQDTRPRFVGNSVLGAAGPTDGQKATKTFGAWLQAGCHGVLEGNGLIAGLMGGRVGFTAGVYCDPSGGGGAPSHCLISQNAGIVGHAVQDLFAPSGDTPFVDASYGVKCELGTCHGIVRNGVIAGGAARKAKGILLAQSVGTLVDGNLVWPGCATEAAYGIEAKDALARLQNNVVVATGADCVGGELDAYDTQWIALRTSTDPLDPTNLSPAAGAELDVHSNLLFATGHLAQAELCRAAAVSMDNAPGPRGVYRNNILGASVCQGAVSVFAAEAFGGPRYLGFNDLTPDGAAAYWNEGSQQMFATASELDASNASGGPVRFEHNLRVPVDLTQADGNGLPVPPALDTSSPLVDQGTAAGAPQWDIHGEPRPAGDGFDIGADEVH